MFKTVLFIALCTFVIAECKHTEQEHRREARQVDGMASTFGQMAEKGAKAFSGMMGGSAGMPQMPQSPNMPGMPGMPGMPSGR